MWDVIYQFLIIAYLFTLKHDLLRSINHTATVTQNKNNTGTTALERSVA